MVRDSALNVSVGIIAAVMICFAASQASDVFAPFALALFIIALVWPLQAWLQARMLMKLARQARLCSEAVIRQASGWRSLFGHRPTRNC